MNEYLTNAKEAINARAPQINGRPFCEAAARGVAALAIISTGVGAAMRPTPASAEGYIKYEWINPQGGVPANKPKEMVSWTINTSAGRDKVVLAGPLKVSASNGRKAEYKGRGDEGKIDDQTLLIIKNNNAAVACNTTVEAWGGSNWEAEVVDQPDDTRGVADQANAMVRDAVNRNGIKEQGLTGNLHTVVVDCATQRIDFTGRYDAAGNLIPDNAPVAAVQAAPAAPATQQAAQTQVVTTTVSSQGVAACEDRAYGIGDKCVAQPGQLMVGDNRYNGKALMDGVQGRGTVTAFFQGGGVIEFSNGGSIKQVDPAKLESALAMTVADTQEIGCGTGRGCYAGVRVNRN